MIILDAVDAGEIPPISAKLGIDSSAVVSRVSTVIIDWARTAVDMAMVRIRMDAVGYFMVYLSIHST